MGYVAVKGPQARALILTMLESAEQRSLPVSEMLAAGRAQGISKRTMERAKLELGVVSRSYGRRYGPNNKRGIAYWHWWLPTPEVAEFRKKYGIGVGASQK